MHANGSQSCLQHDAGVLLGTAGFGIGCHLGIEFGENGLARDHTHLAFGITIVSLSGVQILVGAPSTLGMSLLMLYRPPFYGAGTCVHRR